MHRLYQTNKQTNKQTKMKLHWGHAITIFFVIFLSLAVFFIIFSLRQNRDLASENYYNDGAEYTKQIYINERSMFFKDSLSININNNTVEFNFCDSITENSNTIFVDFYRPSNKQFDYKIQFDAKTEPYLVDKSKLKKGRFIVTVFWEIDSLNYEITKNLFVD